MGMKGSTLRYYWSVIEEAQCEVKETNLLLRSYPINPSCDDLDV